MVDPKLIELRQLFTRSNIKLQSLHGKLGKEGNNKNISSALSHGPLQAFLIETADAHQSEYVSQVNKRREFLTNFTGSAGSAVVTKEKALLWTDGRYFLQAENQLNTDWILMKSGEVDVLPIEKWAAKYLNPQDGCFGIDPLLTSVSMARRLQAALEPKNVDLVALGDGEKNLIDIVWEQYNRPQAQPSEVLFLSNELTGASVNEKLSILRSKIQDKNANAIVLSALDDIAWLFNIRGKDIMFNPVVTSYAMITMEKAILFVHPRDEITVHDEFTKRDGMNTIVLENYDHVVPYLIEYCNKYPENKILVDPVQCNVALFLAIPSTMRMEATSLVMELKAIKNEVEINGMKEAHKRDGAALVTFFNWLEKQMASGAKLSEYEAATQQERIREAFKASAKTYVSLSFDTISSIGPNGAIIHYKPEETTCAQINSHEIYLNDSGAQYLDGTTDVTRTLHFGTPTEYEKECFTRVLQAHIALATAIFPNKCEGVKLDAITRAPLWKNGLDYNHGTGHGVGSFLNVHEKGVLLSFRLNPNGLLIQENMIISNEPGYYEDGHFGIRIESLVVIRKTSKLKGKTALKKEFCEMETITMAPIQQKLINIELLSPQEIQWVNEYHAIVRQNLEPLLADDPDTLEYLIKETQPIVKE